MSSPEYIAEAKAYLSSMSEHDLEDSGDEFQRLFGYAMELSLALTASEKRAQDMAKALLVANKLWRLAVEDNWPWNDGDIQDKLTEIGLLKATDMRAEDSPEECLNCIGDCHTCYRAVQLIEDAPGNANE